MVLEEYLKKSVKRKVYSILLGILYVLISYGTAKLFFPNDISTAVIILTTILFVPSLSTMLGAEERIERRDGARNFFRDHKVLMEIFLYLFIGIFIGYLIIGNYAPSSIQYQKNILESQDAMTITKTPANLTGIILNNIEVIVIAFVLSLFYGAGALFLIVRSSSVFAVFVIMFSQLASKTSAAIFLIHFIPELFGFLLAAMAGGVISKAITREKIGSPEFKNVVKDGSLLFGLAIIIIIIAGFLETYVTSAVINSLV